MYIYIYIYTHIRGHQKTFTLLTLAGKGLHEGEDGGLTNNNNNNNNNSYHYMCVY